MTEVALALIDDDPGQVRRSFSSRKAKEMAGSVGRSGVIQPVLLKPINGRFKVICGARRVIAARANGLATIPAEIRDCPDQDIAVLQLVENIQREPLNLADLGHAVRHLVERIGFEATCERLSRSPAWVSKHNRIPDLPSPVADAVESGVIKDADAAHDVAAIHQRAPGRAREMLDRQAITRAGARQARREIEEQAHCPTTFALLSAGQREQIARRFLTVMENPAMSPMHKMTAMQDLLRDAHQWSGA